MKKEFRVIVDN